MQTKKETNVAFASHLRRLMRERGLNDLQLARATGLSHTAIANYKRGRLPKLDALRRLAGHFGIALEHLLHGSDPGLALRVAATVADHHSSARVEERQGKFESVAVELMEWQQRARSAEAQLGIIETTLTDLLRQLRKGRRARAVTFG
jgi:transcriptional regulator with XRE-family HTH domain